MNRLRLLATYILLLATAAAPAPAQKSEGPAGQSNNYQQAIVAAQIQQVTDALTKDAASFTRLERAMLWARLGEMWWTYDADAGRGWLQKAVEELESAAAPALGGGDRSKPAERGQLLDTVRVVLRIAAPRDKKLSARLISILVPPAEREGSGGGAPSDLVADTLLEAALLVVSEDPAGAARLGSAALHAGNAGRIHTLLLALRPRDSKLADSLFAEALARAQATQDSNLLSSVAYAAYPNAYNPALKPATFPDALRAGLLDALIKGVLQAEAAQGARDCTFANIIAPLLGEVERAAPQRAGAVRAALTQCQTSSPRVAEAVGNSPPQTVEDFLAAAAKAQQPELRVFMLSRAAQAAARQGDFIKAVSILDNMTGEERGLVGEAWAPIRVEYATQAALSHLKQSDYAAIEQVITATPAELRGFVTLGVGEKLIEVGKDKDANAYAVELLERTRRGFGQRLDADLGLFYPYLTLVRLYAKAAPAEAPAVLREAVKIINRAATAKSAPESENVAAGLLEPVEIPRALVDLNAGETIDAVAAIEPPRLRTRARLSVLSSLLTYREALTRRPPGRAAQVKQDE